MEILNLLCRRREFRGRLEANRKRMYRVAYSWCHDPHLADDLVQEAITKALQNAGKLRKFEALDSWLFSILTNCWRGHLRARRDTVEFDENLHEGEASAQNLNSRLEVIQGVRNAVESLPLAQREVVTLVDLEGFSYAEVAEILAIPIGTVMSRLCRARQALKARLLEEPAVAPQQGRAAKLVRVK